MGSDDTCNTGLVLGLGLSTSPDTPKSNKGFFAAAAAAMNNNNNLSFGGGGCGEPSLTLGISGGGGDELCGRQASPHSAVSSFSNVSVKRERDHGGSSEEVEIEEDEEERDRVSRKIDEDEDFSNNTRKKLRLTKEQSALLEDSFKLHSTLNPKQKQALARQLNLRPRQVEVWFQNRRARTKLKQTEVDCEFLKKCCETLTDENRRLQKELQELKAMKLPQPFYMQMPAATLTMCPSCERIGGNGSDGAPKTQFAIAAASKPYFFNPFTNPSAAC